MRFNPDKVDLKICVICEKLYSEWGNNAMPLEHGQCCDVCNEMVIEARLFHKKLIGGKHCMICGQLREDCRSGDGC